MINKIIFVSIDGLTDPLGQSQILPYLTGLAQKGYNITIVSCEKDEIFIKNKETITTVLRTANIKWKYCFYNNKIPFLSQWLNYKKLKQLTEREVRYSNEPVVIHCRSYLPALIGFFLKQKYSSKFIFDMRGFWADERIDGNIWKLNNLIHKMLYDYFKRREQLLINEADYIVTLSENGKNIVTEWAIDETKPIEVIPCCVDTNHFTIFTSEKKLNQRKNTGITEDALVVGYLGSLGTWYMLDEMLDFFIELKNKKTNAILFFVTQDSENIIKEATKRKNINPNAILVKYARRNEVPLYIATFDIGLFFIKPLFSKQGSSPTKMAEVLACGVPVITNTGIGDCNEIINDYKCGILVSNFTKVEYNKAIEKIETLLQRPAETFRKVALEKFALEDGISKYQKIYTHLSDDK